MASRTSPKKTATSRNPRNPFQQPVVDIRIARARRLAVEFLDDMRIDFDSPWEALRTVQNVIVYELPDAPTSGLHEALKQERLLVELLLQLKRERLW